MGKIKKKKQNHRPLAEDILEPYTLKSPRREKQRSAKRKDDPEDYIDSKLSLKILEQAREQQDDIQEGKRERKKTRSMSSAQTILSMETDNPLASSDEDSEKESEGDFDEPIEVDEDDEKAISVFMNQNPPVRQTLADVILEKIRDKKTELSTVMTESGAASKPQMDDRVVTVFKSVGKILTKYRSGKLPKAFKVIPSLSNWEEVLNLTEPENWTAGTMYQATRIFASNMNSEKAQRFYNLVLLPRVRDDISEYRRLNYHMYMAVKKAVFKPAAFFKGIILPLCESGTCTLREALILSSVLAKVSIPMLHSSAALLKIAEMDYSGTNSLFIRTLLDKKYALPYRVVDTLVHHFLRFLHETRELPVLWHQSFLTFTQRYKEDMSSEQKETLLDLTKRQTHHQITPEIRRELLSSKSRDSEAIFEMVQ